MAKKKLEDRMDHLSALGEGELTADAIGELRAAMDSRHSLLVATAARIASRREVSDLIPGMTRAFNRLAERKAADDPGCEAKNALANALNILGVDDEQLFVRGVHFVQWEKVWGGSVDTAPGLRVTCAWALARLVYDELFLELVTLLADPCVEVRRAAVEILGSCTGETPQLLVRLKLLSGDQEPEVIGDCFEALMAIHAGRSFDLVAAHLDDSRPAIAESAALAIGRNGPEKALDALIRARDRRGEGEMKKAFLMAIAMTRSDDAFRYLMNVLCEEDPWQATGAVAAMDLLARDEERERAVRTAVNERDEAVVSRAWARAFEE